MKTPILLALMIAIAAIAMPASARAEDDARSERNGRHLCHHHHFYRHHHRR